MQELITTTVDKIEYKVLLDTEVDTLLAFRTKKEVENAATINDLADVNIKKTYIGYFVYKGLHGNYYYTYEKEFNDNGTMKKEEIHTYISLSSILGDLILSPKKWDITEHGKRLICEVPDL